METQLKIDQSSPASTPEVEDETHEAALRIERERLEKDRRLREVAREAAEAVPHELHTSIGG